MAIVCPTVLAADPHEFREQVERLTPFAKRIQIDLMDGVFAPTKSVELKKVWLPDNVDCDLHLMYKNPAKYYQYILKLMPSMVIFHYESEVNHIEFANSLKTIGIKAGLAVLKETSIAEPENLLPAFDHLLIFSGDLGRFGGVADLSQLEKAEDAKQINTRIEIGWDGGVNSENIFELAKGGVDVLNVGGFIQQASNPQEAYATLESLLH